MSSLTSGRLLVKNTIWNLAGQLLPMAAGIVCVPPLLHHLGVARFGILSLAWILIGYFGLFDLGLGRAVTKVVADKLGHHKDDEIPAVVWTAISVMFLMGTLACIVTLFASPWLVRVALKVPTDLQLETLSTLRVLAFSLPIVTVTSGLKGVLEAQQKFAFANLIRIPMSVVSFLGPLLALPFSNSLVPIIAILVGIRILGFVAHLLACLWCVKTLRHGFTVQWSQFLVLFRFGSWITVSNLIGPLVSYVDRFLVASLVSVSLVAYYTTPLDLVTRLTVIPGALAGVLFPAFALSLIQDPDRASILLGRALKYILLAIFPVILVLIALAPEILKLWLGAAFSAHSSVVLRWLAAGVFINCFGQVPFAFLQSANRPDLTAKLYIFELPVYGVLIWGLTSSFGLTGAAIAWSVRVIVDCFLLLWLSNKLHPQRSGFMWRMLVGAVSSLAIFYLVTIPDALIARSLITIGLLATFGVSAWFRGLEQSERRYFSNLGLTRPIEGGVANRL